MAKKAASQKNPAKEKNVSDEKILTKKIAQEKDADFSGFTSIEDAAVESLAKHNSGVCLNGLTSLSDAAAESLAKYQSGFLELNGLTSLSDAAVESLAKHNRDLCLNGLTSLSDAAAAALSMHSRNIELEGITKLSDNAAKALAAHKQGLKLTALETLSDNALVLFKSRRFTLSHDLRKSMPAARTRIRESDKTKPKKKSSSLAAVLSKADVKKLRSLLQQKTAESVTLGLQLMKSLGVGDAVFTAPIRHQVGKVAHDWLRGGERTRADYELYHDCAIRPFWDSLRATTGKFIDLVNIMPGTGTIGETVVRPDSKQRIMHKFNKLIMGYRQPANSPLQSRTQLAVRSSRRGNGTRSWVPNRGEANCVLTNRA
ncbi:MAG: hypothetical protein NTZ72_13760 [Afipia sp.]|nr:hypothetical protein [Afipia sp.]